MRKGRNMRVFIDLLWYFKLKKRNYALGVLVLILVALVNLIPPYIIRVLIDEIGNGILTSARLAALIAILLGVGASSYILRYAWRMEIFGSAVELAKLLRNRLYEHFTRLSPQFYHGHRTGDLMAHATNDIQAIEMTAGEGVLTLVDSITTGGLVIAAMAIFVSWKLTLIALLPMPFMAWITSYYGTLLNKRFHTAQEAFSELNDKVQENISGVRVIKAFGQEDSEIESFRKLSDAVVEKNVAVARVDSLFDPTIQLIVGISFFLSLAFGSIYVVERKLSIGQLTQFTIYLGQMIWPMLAFGWLFNIVERGRASYSRVEGLLAMQTQVADTPGALDIVPSGKLLININSFSYAEKPNPALKGIRVEIAEGQTLGIVGKTGSGKTTLLRLLIRDFDCTDGDIIIGDTSIYAVKLACLRRSIGYVPQDTFLFSTTIAENISFGRHGASLDDIHRAAELAAIHEDICKFPEGYNTLLGDRGVTLSGGQKQRVSIARALLLQPELLILDDCLSAIDAKTEKIILNTLRTQREGKTTLISAHRLSAIEHADLIIVLDNGQIVERGKHAQLLELEGWYSSMYRRQQLESLLEQGGGENS
jgi:ATP-binding cassette, subfamily B, multidrug efflux pump